MKEKADYVPVLVFKQSCEGDVVAEAKESADDQVLSKHLRETFMDVDALIEKTHFVRPPK